MTSSMSSSVAHRKHSSGSHIHHKVDTKKDAYIPPEFDFDKVESVHESIDIDEVSCGVKYFFHDLLEFHIMVYYFM